MSVCAVSAVVRVVPKNGDEALYVAAEGVCHNHRNPTSDISSFQQLFVNFGHSQWFPPMIARVPYNQDGYVDIFFVVDGHRYSFNKRQTGAALFEYNLGKMWFDSCIFDTPALFRSIKYNLKQYNIEIESIRNTIDKSDKHKLEKVWKNRASQLYSLIMTTDGIDDKLDTLVDTCVMYSRQIDILKLGNVEIANGEMELGKTPEEQTLAELSAEFGISDCELRHVADVVERSGVNRVSVCDMTREKVEADQTLHKSKAKTNWFSAIPFFKKFKVGPTIVDAFGQIKSQNRLLFLPKEEALERMGKKSKNAIRAVLKNDFDCI